MDPSEEDDVPFDDSDDNDPIIRELRNEMIRLEAQLDQLAAAAQERAEEVVELRTRIASLEVAIEQLRVRFRRYARMRGWIAAMYGVAIGMWLSWLLRQF